MLNIVLDYLAIKFNLGISGVAWATVIIETIYAIRVVRLAKDTVTYKLLKAPLLELLNLVKHGIIDRIFDRGGKLVLDIILSRLGTYEYAAHIILDQIESFINDFCYGFGIGFTTNMGIKLGKNNRNDVLELKSVINKITSVFSIVMPIVIFVFLIILLPLLLKEQEALIIAYTLIPFVVIYSALIPIRYKYGSMIEGMKELKFNAEVSIFSNIIKVLLSYVLCMYIGVHGVWLTFSISYTIIIISLKRKVKNYGLY